MESEACKASFCDMDRVYLHETQPTSSLSGQLYSTSRKSTFGG